MDAKFTELLKDWLEKPSEERDYTVGALYILQLTGNKILYTNLIAQLPKSKEAIEYQVQKHYNFRVLDLTRQQVDEMKVKAEKIVVEVKTELDALDSPSPSEPHKTGKRDDHDALPDEIKALYVENLSLMREIRELHMKMRSLSLTDHPCPNSEIYPFVKEIIRLDKKRRKNYRIYDAYGS